MNSPDHSETTDSNDRPGLLDGYGRALVALTGSALALLYVYADLFEPDVGLSVIGETIILIYVIATIAAAFGPSLMRTVLDSVRTRRDDRR